MPKKTASFILEVDQQGAALLTMDLPAEKVNKLSMSVMEELDEIIKKISSDKEIKGLIILSGKKDVFIAGADISEIENISDPAKGKELAARGQDILGKLENLPFPVLSAIHGACLGGGLELALACHYRIITDHPKTILGLPEVKLGIHPGFGGTQRLPRLVGLRNSLDIILTGKNVYPKKALKIGMADKVVPVEYLLDQAKELLIKKSKTGYSRPIGIRKKQAPLDRLMESNKPGRDFIFKKARESVLEKTKGHYPATLKALQVIKEGLSLHLEGGLAIEASSLGEMAATDVCKNLISVFYLQETLKKETGVKDEVTLLPVKTAAVIGAGIMGGGIAQLFADKGLPVRMKDINNDAIGHGLKSAARVFKGKLKKRIIDKREFALKMGNISTSLNYRGLNKTDLVVEAVVEKMAIKQSVLKECEGYLNEDAILASNTSSLSITEMASAVKRPHKVAGMHFFNPVDKMPLVEVIRGKETSDETTATIVAMSKKLGKIPVVVKDREGFLVNRLLMPYLNEALFILEDGTSIKEIDKALLDFGMPMGAFILLDEIGLDIGYHVAEILYAAFGDRMEPAKLMKKVVDSGKLGKKNSKGYYIYQKGKRDKPDETIDSLREGTKREHLGTNEIVDRCILIMLNEAAHCLEEKIVDKPEYVDGGMIFGTGFPPFRGGLLRYAESRGLQEIVTRLEEFSTKYGERYKPAKLLKKLAQSGKGFYS